MLKQQALAVYKALIAADLVTTIVSFAAAYWVRGTYFATSDLGGLYPFDRYAWLLLIILPTWAVLLHVFNAYRSYRISSFIDELFSVGKTALTGGLLVGAIAFVSKAEYLSRIFIFSFIVINMLFFWIERGLIRMISSSVRKRGYNFRSVVIVGINDIARDIARRINNYQGWGLKLIGFIATDPGDPRVQENGVPVLGKLHELERIVGGQVVDEVIIAVPGAEMSHMTDTLLMLEEHGISARIVANIFPHVIAKMRIEELETVPLLTFSTAPSDMVALAVKRLFDIVVSATLLALCAPIMLGAAIAITVTSRGPILFRQKRSGLHGRVFTLYKFRSMYADAETRKKELEQFNEMGGPVFKMKDDPRVTPFGRFIRKTSLDEFPQFWNVLKGDMSIVGPRPPIPDEVAKYERWQRRRLSMRPGVTCLWQISGRNNIQDFNEWVNLDLQYIDTWSLALDLKIFLKTIPIVLLRKGAE